MKPRKNLTRPCMICNKEIILDKENYCRLTDYKKGKFFMECFYHNNCYVNQIKFQNPNQIKMQKMFFNLAKRTDKLLNKVGVEEEKEYVVG